MRTLWGQARIGLQYLLFHRGPLTISAGYAAAFVRTRPEVPRPDAQIYFINFSTARRGGVLHPFSGFTLSVSQTQVESRGSVQIAAPDPRTPPAIRYNYLATERDRRSMVDGLKLVRRIAGAAPLRQYVAAEEFPGPRVQSDEDWLGFCREAGDTVFHPTSTCRMGTGAGAVVDPRLRVNGVERLRVVDASVMPAVPSGNINATVIAIAEKAADLILADARQG
jgi:choline dehydrogenase